MVSSLLRNDKMEWDVDILRDLFNANDIQQILKIPLSCSRTEDAWMWVEGETRDYSVKSAYRSLCQDYYEMPALGFDFNWLKL